MRASTYSRRKHQVTELRSIPAIKHLLVWYLDSDNSAGELNFFGGKSRRQNRNSVHYKGLVYFESELIMTRLRSKINASRNSRIIPIQLIKESTQLFIHDGKEEMTFNFQIPDSMT